MPSISNGFQVLAFTTDRPQSVARATTWPACGASSSAPCRGVSKITVGAHREPDRQADARRKRAGIPRPGRLCPESGSSQANTALQPDTCQGSHQQRRMATFTIHSSVVRARCPFTSRPTCRIVRLAIQESWSSDSAERVRPNKGPKVSRYENAGPAVEQGHHRTHAATRRPGTSPSAAHAGRRDHGSCREYGADRLALPRIGYAFLSLQLIGFCAWSTVFYNRFAVSFDFAVYHQRGT